jgi:preprotein translocase subunit YajC
MNHVVLAQMAGGEGPSAFGPLIMMGAIFAIFYLLIFRPQQKQDKQKEDFRTKLKKGDEVIAVGGLYGRVAELKGTTVWIDLAPNVRVRAERRAIDPPPSRPAKADEKESSAK